MPIKNTASIPRNACVACETYLCVTSGKTLRQTDKHTDRQTPNKVIPMCRYASQATQQNSSLDMYYFGIYCSCWNNNFMSCTGICLSVFSLALVNPISWSTISTSPLLKLLVSDWWTSTNFEPCIYKLKCLYMYATEFKPCMNLCIYLDIVHTCWKRCCIDTGFTTPMPVCTYK